MTKKTESTRRARFQNWSSQSLAESVNMLAPPYVSVTFQVKDGREFSPPVRKKFESALAKFATELSRHCASRGGEFPDRVAIEFSDGVHEVFSRRKSKVLTKRQKELNLESSARSFARFLEFTARSDQERADIVKWKQDYDMALFGKLRSSEKKRAAFEFLRRFHNAELYDHESANAEAKSLIGCNHIPAFFHVRSAQTLMFLLRPLVNALHARDEEFFKGLREAVHILNDRISNSKDPNIGSGDTFLNKWLLEYKLTLLGGQEKHTPHKLNEQEVSKFRSIKDEKLHERLHELGVPHKDEPRGKASPNYGKAQLNLPPKRRKKV